MLVFKARHIPSMFSVVTMEIAAEFIYVYAIARRDVRGLATVHRMVDRINLGRISIAVFIAGIVFGLLTALTGEFDFLAGWLIAAYVLVATIFVGAGLLWPRVLLPLGVRRWMPKRDGALWTMSCAIWLRVVSSGSMWPWRRCSS